jgi:hypothetical protein
MSDVLHQVEDAFSSFHDSADGNSSLDESRTSVSELNSTSFVESSLVFTTDSSINSTLEESTFNWSDAFANQSSLVLSGSSYVDELECSDLSNSFSNSKDSSTVVEENTIGTSFADDSSETHSRSSGDNEVDVEDQIKSLVNTFKSRFVFPGGV